MAVLYLTIPLSLALGAFFLVMFIRAVQKGQFDNLEGKKTIIFDINHEKRNEK